MHLRAKSRRGFVLIAMCASLFLLMAMIGLAFDLGRVYIARNEAQIFTDAAAMTAASKLDGSADGLAKARAAVAALPARWNLGTSSFTGVKVEFSADGEHWSDSATAHLARVSAPANDVEITFLRVVGAPQKLSVASQSVANSNPVRLVE